jgi:type IV secretory pathway VirB2 component (pilin)
MNLVSLGAPALALRSHVTARVTAMTPRQRKMGRILSLFGLVALASLLSAELGLLSNGLLRTIAIIALIAAGLGWLTGRVNTGALVTVVIGIAIIFSAPWIVDQIAG